MYAIFKHIQRQYLEEASFPTWEHKKNNLYIFSSFGLLTGTCTMRTGRLDVLH